MTYRAVEDLALTRALDHVAEVGAASRGRVEDFAAIAAAERDVLDLVQVRVEQAWRPWWRRWF